MEIFCLTADFHPLSESLLNEDLGGGNGCPCQYNYGVYIKMWPDTFRVQTKTLCNNIDYDITSYISV